VSFPNIIYGDFGDERIAQSSAIGTLPLGTRMILPDGRMYAHCQASATALVTGKLYQGEAVASGTGNIKSLAVVTAIAGAYTAVITMSATGGITAGQYDDGYLFSAASTGTGSGYAYKIKTASTAAAASTTTVTLYEPVKVTMAAGTTTVGLRVNEFKNILLTTADTVRVNTLAGISANSCAAAYYTWIQRKGLAPCLTDNTTLIVGTPATASTTVVGAVGGESAATTLNTNALGYTAIGYVVSVAASAEYSLIDLKLE
jgi:hypothetical protein